MPDTELRLCMRIISFLTVGTARDSHSPSTDTGASGEVRGTMPTVYQGFSTSALLTFGDGEVLLVGRRLPRVL